MTIAISRLVLFPLLLLLATTPADRAAAAEEEPGLALFGASTPDLPPAPPLA